MIKSIGTGIKAARNVLCASVAVLALHSCATTNTPSATLTAADLLSAPYALSSGQPFDVDAFFGALPGAIAVTYSDAVFDPALGAMVVSDLRFGAAGREGPGVRADRALIWGADVTAMETVFSGAGDLNRMAPLFDRLTLEGVRSESMQWEAGSESAAFSVEKMVIDGFAARSFQLAPKDGAKKGVDALRRIAATMNSFSYDGVAYSNLSFRLNDNRGDNVLFTVAESFARGYRSGAVEYQSSRGIYALIEETGNNPLVEVSQQLKDKSAKSPVDKILNKPSSEAVEDLIRHPAAMLAAAASGLATEYHVDFTETRGSDISGGLLWLSRWELPPITETNLLDFGASTVLGYSESWDGQLIRSVERAVVSASDFYWLVPSNYSARFEGETMNVSAILDGLEKQTGAGFATESAEQWAQIREAVSALGAEQIVADSGVVWNWNGETGDVSLSAFGDAADLTSGKMGVRLGGPSLAQWDAMARSQTPAMAGVAQMMLSRLNYSLTDKGILDRAFAYAASENGGTGPEFRQSVAAMARLSGAQAGQANPRIASYANAIADFIASGGTIELIAAPQSPVGLLEAQVAAQSAPQTLPDLLNITITHTD